MPCRESGEYKNNDIFKHYVWPYLDSTLGRILLLRAWSPISSPTTLGM
jgi:hypothetical protein